MADSKSEEEYTEEMTEEETTRSLLAGFEEEGSGFTDYEVEEREEDHEEAREEDEPDTEIKAPPRRKTKNGIEIKNDGEPIYPFLDPAESDKKFDTGEQNLLKEYQKQLQKYCAAQKKFKENWKLKAKKKKTNSDYTYEKLANSPKIPSSCAFDPQDTTGKVHKEPIDFNEEFDEATNMMTNEKIRAYNYKAACSRAVKQMIFEHEKTLGIESLSYDDMKALVLKKYATEAYKEKLYEEADDYKQGKLPMRVYLTQKISKMDKLNDHGSAMSKFTRRRSILKGIRPDILRLAQNDPNFRNSKWDEASEKLCSLDTANPRKASAAVVGEIDIKKLIAKELKNHIASLNGKGGGGHDNKRKRGNDKNEKSQLFSQGKMKSLYSEKQWEHRLVNVKNKVSPNDNPELYEKDCYPLEETNGEKPKPACVYCRKLGHTVLECRLLKKRASK
jgi:hypothetical protein